MKIPLIQKILAIMSLLFFLNSIWVLLRSGVSNTFLLNLGLLAGFLILTVFYERLIKMKWLIYAIFISAFIFIGFATFIMVYGTQDTATFTEDAAIVLGMAINGTEPSHTLRRRLDRAVEFHLRNPEAIFIVSGGLGHGNTVSEAYVMSNYLEAAGVPSHMIFKEANSHSTFQNMYLSLEILETVFPNDFTLAVITNDFHMFRSIRFTEIVGMDRASSFHANTPLFTLPGALTREVAAIIKMWLIGT